MTIKTVTFTDSTNTGFQWTALPSHPTKISWTSQMMTSEAAALAKRFRRNGWTVVVHGYGPGSGAI